jgi:hypothetical protein
MSWVGGNDPSQIDVTGATDAERSTQRAAPFRQPRSARPKVADVSGCQPPMPIANTCIAVNTPTPLLTFGSVIKDTVLPDCSGTEAK